MQLCQNSAGHNQVYHHGNHGPHHREAEHIVKHVATCIAAKWDKSCAETCVSGHDFSLLWFERQACICGDLDCRVDYIVKSCNSIYFVKL